MPARRNVGRSGKENGKPGIHEDMKPGPDRLRDLLNSRYKSDQAAGLMIIGDDIEKLSHFAKTSGQKDVRAMCVAKLVILKSKGNENAKEALRDVAENAGYNDSRECASKHSGTESG